MKSDITRDTFAVGKHFSRVISQQGRVTLDADGNEQTAILLHYLRTLAVDLVGPYAAPVMAAGFRLSKDTDERIWISQGRYYVDGILVENESSTLYTQQPHYPLKSDDAFAKAIDDRKNADYWVYLDVWERHVTALEDDTIREKALGGSDTCTRGQVVWQVKALDLDVNIVAAAKTKQQEWLNSKKSKLQANLAKAKGPVESELIQKEFNKVSRQLDTLNQELKTCDDPLGQLLPCSDASVGARVDPGPQITDACITSPDSKYRGAENQLYRVEIHRGGIAGEATFKWSRENGSVATAWLGTSGHDLEVANSRGFSAGNWVELIDDVAELRGIPGLLVRLAKVETGRLSVNPEALASTDGLQWNETLVNPKVRRWDQFETEDLVLEDDGSILIQETPVGASDSVANWIDLEDGIQVQFAEGGFYRTGDYWLIPARVATGKVEWPAPATDASGTITTHLSPHGVVHHFAPLGFASWLSEDLSITPCDCEFEPLSSCFSPASMAIGADRRRVVTGPTAVPGQGTVEPATPKQGSARGKKPKVTPTH